MINGAHNGRCSDVVYQCNLGAFMTYCVTETGNIHRDGVVLGTHER